MYKKIITALSMLLLFASFSANALFNHPVEVGAPISNWYQTDGTIEYIEDEDVFETGDVTRIKISYDISGPAGSILHDYVNIKLTSGGPLIAPIPGTSTIEVAPDGSSYWHVAEFMVSADEEYRIRYGFSQLSSVDLSEVVTAIEPPMTECGGYY